MREYGCYSPTCMILIDLSVTLPDTHLQIRRAVPATGFRINSFHLATGGFLGRGGGWHQSLDDDDDDDNNTTTTTRGQ